MKRNICAIVISYDSINECVNTITALQHQVDHIVIVNNFSNSAVSEKLNLLYMKNSKISLIFLDQNYGIAYALNRGVEFTLSKKFEWIITMDQDSIASHNMIDEMFLCISTAPRNSPILCLFSSYGIENHSTLPCKEVYMGITSGNIVHSSIYKRFGTYDESYFIDSVDFEFFLRIKNNGIKFYQVINAIMIHSLGTKKDDESSHNFFPSPYTHSPLRRYYIVRNHLDLCKKYFFKNPVYLSWKTLNIIRLTISIALFEKNQRVKNLKMIALGVKHFFIGKTGKL